MNCKAVRLVRLGMSDCMYNLRTWDHYVGVRAGCACGIRTYDLQGVK